MKELYAGQYSEIRNSTWEEHKHINRAIFLILHGLPIPLFAGPENYSHQLFVTLHNLL